MARVLNVVRIADQPTYLIHTTIGSVKLKRLNSLFYQLTFLGGTPILVGAETFNAIVQAYIDLEDEATEWASKQKEEDEDAM